MKERHQVGRRGRLRLAGRKEGGGHEVKRPKEDQDETKSEEGRRRKMNEREGWRADALYVSITEM